MTVFKDDGRLYAPAALRNRAALRSLLRGLLPKTGTVLEIASGTGEHAVFFAEAFPGVEFLTSDTDLAARASIAAWIAETGLANIAQPLNLDPAKDWNILPVDAVLCINLLHLAPHVTDAFLGHAASVLSAGGFVLAYGPFDDALKENIMAVATVRGLVPVHEIPMPEGHVALVLRRS